MVFSSFIPFGILFGFGALAAENLIGIFDHLEELGFCRFTCYRLTNSLVDLRKLKAMTIPLLRSLLQLAGHIVNLSRLFRFLPYDLLEFSDR